MNLLNLELEIYANMSYLNPVDAVSFAKPFIVFDCSYVNHKVEYFEIRLV